ncbi:hypothetical protein HF086_008421 [Spodoptera exigua]|uniref:Protein zwilch n=1 Tax=Spodoptera exigua TaxID=7107 RepID=A0A922SFQ2_SPOEX|nr:hypothetical protein HF086_008421 [Spodoptera exigua]
MDNILKPVIDSYPKYYIEKQKSPNYVEMYTKTNRDIVLVCNKAKQTTYISENAIKDNRNEAVLDDTMMTDEPQLWIKEEGTHSPISLDIARQIANLYNKNRDQVTTEDAVPLWILTNPEEDNKPLLVTVQSDSTHFARGIVTYEGNMNQDDVDLDLLVEEYAKLEGLSADLYLVSGISYASYNTDELVNAPHGGVTELRCEWSGKTLHTPYISCKVNFEQEIIVGHLASPCNAIWRSVCALHNMNQLLVDMTAAGYSSVNLETASIRNNIPGARRYNNSKRVNELLNETETYAYTAECPAGGCICVTEDTTTLGQCLNDMNTIGSSNDFTYKLWDILRDCETAEELITLLIQALKFISSGKIRPFLVLKLSRGHSQAAKVLKNLRSSPPQALSLVAQVGTEKTMWEYTRVMSLLEHSFFIAGIWNSDARTHESIEQINQTIQDMTMSGGDFQLNPFESFTSAEHSIRLDCESFYEEDTNELTVPLITDEIDISPWKNLLMKFAQVHVCLEHLHRAESCLRADFASLKPIASRLLEHYVSDKSPIRTVGQLMSDPIQKISMPIANNIVQDHLKKPAFWYRVEMSRKENAANKGIQRESKMVYVFSQQPVFPPSMALLRLNPPSEEVAEVTTIAEELKYHVTKYTFISNKLVNKLPF